MSAMFERNGIWHPVPKPDPLKTVVRNTLLNALAYTDGQQNEAAKLLGISTRAMTYNLQVYNIPTSKSKIKSKDVNHRIRFSSKK